MMRAARLRPALRVGRARRCFASASAPDASAPSVRAMCNGVWDMYHAGHANAWLQAKLNTGAAGQDVSIVVAVHDGADVLEHKGAPTIFDDAERRAMAEACKWVSGTVAHVPYDVITEQLMDEHGCAWVSHGDDMIILPGKPHMYSEADEAGRFRMFPRTPGISTTAQRRRSASALASAPPSEADRSTFAASSQAFSDFRSFGATAPAAANGQGDTVYVQGAFDLYNPGDVAFLAAARLLGQRLVVGVLSDADVAAAAGPAGAGAALPVIPLHERALCVLSNVAVDDVLLAPPPRVTPAFLEENGLAAIALDPRPAGRYSLGLEHISLGPRYKLPESFHAVIDSCQVPELTEECHPEAMNAEAVLQRLAAPAEEAAKPKPPLFESGVVGSLPRPEYVRELVLKLDTGGEFVDVSTAEVQEARLRAAMKAGVAMQLQAGCDVVTDGELGRLSYIGIIAELAHGFEIRQLEDGRPFTVVVEKLKKRSDVPAGGILAAEATRLQSILAELGAPDHPYKLTVPAPALLGERMWQEAQSSEAYASYEEFVEDCVPLLAEELKQALALPRPPAVVQIDDPHLCLFVDDEVRAKYPDAEVAAGFAVEKTNEMLSLAGTAGGVEVCVHLCRRAGGKARGEGFDGSLSKITQHINALECDSITVECTTNDDEEGLGSLTELREDLKIGFGCVTVTPGEVDSVQTIVNRVDSLLAAGIAKERIALNPDCGFAPGMGAKVDGDEVYQKLKHQSEAAAILRARYE